MQYMVGIYCYGKCPKISYTKVSDKIANSIDPDQIASLDCLSFQSTKHFKKQLHKKAKFGRQKYGIMTLKF